MSNLGIRRSVVIHQPREKVYRAVVDPTELARYFVDEASGPLETGNTVIWRWQEERDETHCEEATENERLVLTWKPYKVTDYTTRCTITFQPTKEEGATKVELEEVGWRDDETGVASMVEHSSGWTHMLLCMKAYLEHGVDLRH